MCKDRKEKLIVAVLAVVVFVAGLMSGCGTIKGIAHDISWTANKLDRAIVIPDSNN